MEALTPHLLIRADQNQGCTQTTCPVSESVYGYRPNLAATLTFLAIFALSGITYTYQGLATRTWFFTGAMVLGSLSEVLGYTAKMLLWDDPFSDTGFKMSVVLLTFAPAFYAAGIYYTLKHICLTFGSGWSRLRPSWYTYIFISCDVFSIVLQAVGGACAAAAETDGLLNAGDNIMITGLATQVFTLVVFGLLAADYGVAVYRHWDGLNPATVELRQSLRFKLFIVALWAAFLGILIRCTYRVAELAGGWVDNPILRNQGLFIGLDSVAVGIAAVILNVFHPGYCFPSRQERKARQNLGVPGEDLQMAKA
ncbi:hypothetical protein KC332_g15168 [Hortaea werneckii]|uniref:Sphingoid long-chain base transporter RSB1 n=1 Tax=Hortaea werneckii EXF-2000 TaxID=1157616 RepID=A0A1Z5T0C6_HORWE|nr:hypothetical protein KC358_g15827 [Hortaea werneckii]OTA28000.1 hypothetical protein BTJ68_09599 [Hortaea werneckii EXF-2000]KAI6805980.1 hypothetical protein KC350_g14371 [Hortaea werneckii]KAI6906618.1 hypothetical protein KC348_g14564 [Hortaea werneckii]KAI6921977.1 hypothetical protein KC341_g15640 [Hortaea werneckii]